MDTKDQTEHQQLHREINRLKTAIVEIIELAHHLPSGIDEDANPTDRSPEDMTAHIGGLIVKAGREAIGTKDADRQCRIFGVDGADGFERICPEEEAVMLCKEIWEHPDRFSKYPPLSDDAFYKFTKLLWVQYPGGLEVRLADIALMDDVCCEGSWNKNPPDPIGDIRQYLSDHGVTRKEITQR